MGRKTIFIMIIVFVLGLILGLALYGPVSNLSKYEASGGGGNDPSGGIWTGKEYAMPWLWTDQQWGIFSNCVSNLLDKSPNKGTQRWPKCAAKAIAGSRFATKNGGGFFKKIGASGENAVFGFTISSTGYITGKVGATGGGSFSTGDVISGYINPAGGIYMTVGQSGGLRWLGKVASQNGTSSYTGSVVDQDTPKTGYYLDLHLIGS